VLGRTVASPVPNRELLRHTIATLAYRGGKAMRGAPAGFSDFRTTDGSAAGSRTAGAILAHVGDLLDWALSVARGAETWHDSTPQPWDADVARFFDGLTKLDAHLASSAPLACSIEQLFQGPIADALTHVGQIAMLRRLAGSPVRGENYMRADIVAGRVGPEQTPPRREF
jgi:hypothetical protein